MICNRRVLVLPASERRGFESHLKRLKNAPSPQIYVRDAILMKLSMRVKYNTFYLPTKGKVISGKTVPVRQKKRIFGTRAALYLKGFLKYRNRLQDTS